MGKSITITPRESKRDTRRKPGEPPTKPREAPTRDVQDAPAPNPKTGAEQTTPKR